MTIKLLTTGIALFISCIPTAQNFELLTLPVTKKEYIKSEPDIFAAVRAIEADKKGELED